MLSLIIPTFNRPRLLGRLLRALPANESGAEILILDSSSPDIQRDNARAVSMLAGNIRYYAFPAETPPFVKFAEGFRLASTPFAALCADDDIVLPHALAAAAAFLDVNKDHVMAHGVYFDFAVDGRNAVATGIRYAGPSIAGETALARIVNCLLDYQALTYGVYRTAVARHAFDRACKLSSVLCQEICAGLLTLVEGKVARLPLFHYGRNQERFTHYRDFHPMERAVHSPARLVSDYVDMRNVLVAALREQNSDDFAAGDTLDTLDLAHLQYFSRYLHPEVLKQATLDRLAGVSEARLLDTMWRGWESASLGPLHRWLLRFPALHCFKNRHLPRISLTRLLRYADGRAFGDEIGTLNPDSRRSYRIAREMLRVTTGDGHTPTPAEHEQLRQALMRLLIAL